MGLRRQGQARGAELESRLLLKYYYYCAQKIQSLSELGFIFILPVSHGITVFTLSMQVFLSASTLYLSLLLFFSFKKKVCVSLVQLSLVMDDGVGE